MKKSFKKNTNKSGQEDKPAASCDSERQSEADATSGLGNERMTHTNKTKGKKTEDVAIEAIISV